MLSRSRTGQAAPRWTKTRGRSGWPSALIPEMAKASTTTILASSIASESRLPLIYTYSLDWNLLTNCSNEDVNGFLSPIMYSRHQIERLVWWPSWPLHDCIPSLVRTIQQSSVTISEMMYVTKQAGQRECLR